MLDINYVRDHPDKVKQNLKKRFQEDKLAWVDDLLKQDALWKKYKAQSDKLRSTRNALSLEINKLKKEGKKADKQKKEAAQIPQKLKEVDDKMTAAWQKVQGYLTMLPNMLHDKVPLGPNAVKNKVLRTWGKPTKKDFTLLSHSELAEKKGLADFEQGRKVSGQGFNYIMDKLAMLDLALQRYGLDFIMKKGFIPVVPPMLLNKKTLGGAVDLAAFEEVIYKVDNEDLYLIGTAEHSLVSFMSGKTLSEEKLPLKLCAVTPCFRKEIGGHGVDTKGLFRMHQFNKVEQVVYATPETSFKLLEEIQKISEEFFQSLEIPYRVVEICSGDLGGKFAKQYDIEAWFPRPQAYQEVTSAGNCTDYQANRLRIAYTGKEGKKPVHILNNTMVATSRAMVAILENFQNKDGSVTIPKALHKYTGFKKM